MDQEEFNKFIELRKWLEDRAAETANKPDALHCGANVAYTGAFVELNKVLETIDLKGKE